MVGNTYNFLSAIFITATILLLLGKFGVLSTIWDKILSVFVSEEVETPAVVERLAEPSFSSVPEEVTPVFVTKNISEMFEFDGFSQLGSSGPEVSKLQESLGLLGYYDGELSGDYDEATRDALTRTLIERCDWPETTRGIFGPLAQECLYGLEVQFDAVGLEWEVGNTSLPAIISDEAEPLWI